MTECRPNPEDRTFWTSVVIEDESEDECGAVRITENLRYRITEDGRLRVTESCTVPVCSGIGSCIIELNFIVQ